jgi:cyclophilin family peptidyl-prolyl cis-trans isomerase
VRDPETDSHTRHEAVLAVGLIGGEGVVDTMINLLAHPSPQIRAAAVRSLARLDPEGFIVILSGLDPDAHWSVRASLAATLSTLEPQAALPRLRAMLQDADQRVIPAVLSALTSLRAPDGPGILVEHLKVDDPGVRAAAAAGLGELRPLGGAALLVAAYRFAQRDLTHVARVAALKALVEYGAGEATALLQEALSDQDWAVRLQAAASLNAIDATSDASDSIRPAPTRLAASAYEAGVVVNPQVSTQVYLETDRGIIQIELAVLDAPLTVENFVALARQGFYDGVSVHRVVPDSVIQVGDPRGDGTGGPGFTIRDEINQRPFLRGAVGMVLDGSDTGGSQFFIPHSPQPHLDGRCTVFGRVLSGMEVVDQLEQWDVIRRVRIWDGDTFVQD